MLSVVGDVLVIWTFLASLAFVIVYHIRAAWWDNDFGRSLMTYQIAMTVVLGLALPRIFWGGDHLVFQILRVVVFTAVPVALTWRLVVLIRVQRRKKGDA